MNRASRFALPFGLILAACATSGGGSGVLSGTTTTTAADLPADRRIGPVRFTWSDDLGGSHDHGVIRVMLPDGRIFLGRYAREMRPTASSTITAELTNHATTMNCHFLLHQPAAGAAGGGLGSCSLSDGERIDSAVLYGESE